MEGSRLAILKRARFTSSNEKGLSESLGSFLLLLLLLFSARDSSRTMQEFREKVEGFGVRISERTRKRDGETGWTYQHPNGMKCRAAKLGEDYTPSAVARSLSANAEREKQQEATSEKLLAAGVEDVARKRAEEAARIRQQQEAERVLRQAQERAERARVRTRSRDDGERGFSR